MIGEGTEVSGLPGIKNQLLHKLMSIVTERVKAGSVLKDLLAGNQRYAKGQPTEWSHAEKLEKSRSGQEPKAVILSCLDSRVPVEQIFDQGVGDVFVARVAGNVLNEDVVGSMEFAVHLSTAQVIMVLGHTGCGAVHGACAGAELGSLTGLLGKIQRVLPEARECYEGEAVAEDAAFVNLVAERNACRVIRDIRESSPLIAKLEREGDVLLVPAIYELESQTVRVLMG